MIGDVFFVKWVISCLVVKNVGNDSSHAILTLEPRTLDTLKALGVWLFSEDFFFVGQHLVPSMKWNIEQLTLY